MPTTETLYSVHMHPELQNRLDEALSPADGIVAIDDIMLELPKHHAPKKPTEFGRFTRVYRGCIAWAGIDFLYIQLGHELHIIGVADCCESHPKADVVLPRSDRDY